MEVVREVIEDELHLDIPIAGLAKDRKHRTSELLYGFPPLTIGVKQSTPLFHLLENIQNEVHRFAITFHRDKRSKSQVASALDNIKGIGEKRKTALLKTFKSVSRIKQASLEEIAAVVGEAAAKNIKRKPHRIKGISYLCIHPLQGYAALITVKPRGRQCFHPP